MPTPKPQTFAQLRALQRQTVRALVRPLTADDDLQPTWVDGRDMHAVAEEFIKPNERLSAFERLEIYARSYWFRLLECLYDDFPGLRAVVGDEKFALLARAYLEKYPSRSYTLRNLGSRLETFLTESPEWAAPRGELAIDMAKIEWAQIVAFDSKFLAPLSVNDLQGKDPATLRLKFQPYISLLELRYPLDDYLVAMKRNRLRSEASNAVESAPKRRRAGAMRLPRRRAVCLAVHRHENSVYYKRLEPAAYRLLLGLREGLPLAAALESSFAVETPADPAATIQQWFEDWTALGWFARR
jgi:hypothetical protein